MKKTLLILNLFIISSAHGLTSANNRALKGNINRVKSADMVQLLQSKAVVDLLERTEEIGVLSGIFSQHSIQATSTYLLRFESYALNVTKVCTITAQISGDYVSLSTLTCQSPNVPQHEPIRDCSDIGSCIGF